MARIALQTLISVAILLFSFGSCDKHEALIKFIEDNGGKVNARVGLDKNGYRALFASKDIPMREPILTVPSACILNVGAISGSFLTPSLSLLREQLHPNSRFKPYFDALPDSSSVINACTLDEKYWPLLENEYWTNMIRQWQNFLESALAGKANLHMEVTIQEMLGNVNITLQELKDACAMTATRYVDSRARGRLLLVPIFDLANHKYGCEHFLSSYSEGNVMHFLAGREIKAGDEICYSYGAMRDDYAVVHYGFLPEVTDPPRLLSVDHHQFNPNAHHQEYTQEQFEADDADKYAAELKRLQGIQAQLIQLDADAAANKTRPAKGVDPIFDLLLDLQVRRRTAITHEIKRIQDILISLAKSDL